MGKSPDLFAVDHLHEAMVEEALPISIIQTGHDRQLTKCSDTWYRHSLECFLLLLLRLPSLHYLREPPHLLLRGGKQSQEREE